MEPSGTLKTVSCASPIPGRPGGFSHAVWRPAGLIYVAFLLAGLLAGRLGAPAAVAAGGVACIAGAVAFGSRLPALRVAGRQLLISQEMAAGEPMGGPPRTAAAPASSP